MKILKAFESTEEDLEIIIKSTPPQKNEIKRYQCCLFNVFKLIRVYRYLENASQWMIAGKGGSVMSFTISDLLRI